MGVRGLLGCLERSNGCKQVKSLKELVDQCRSESQPRPLIIIDGRTVCSKLLGNSPRLLFDYVEIHRSLSALHTLLTSLNVEVVACFGGTAADFEYFKYSKINHAETIVACMRKWHEYKTIDEIKVDSLKSYRDIAIFIFAFYFKVMCSRYDHEFNIVNYAREQQCLALIGDDTDFLIYNAGFYYWPIKNINYANKTVEMYDMKNFADQHEINFEHLPFFASFLGNHIMSAEKTARYFGRELGIKKKLSTIIPVLTQHRKLSLQQLRQSPCFENILNKIFPRVQVLYQRSLYQDFEKSIAMYADNVYTDRSEELNEIQKYAQSLVLRNKIQSSFLYLLIKKDFFHFIGLQCPGREGANYFRVNMVYADLRKKLYYMLFRDESCTIKEYKFKYSTEEESVQLEVEDIRPLKFDLAVNVDLLNLWKNEDRNIEELKWKLLINSVSVNDGIDINKLRLLEPKYYYPVLILHYLLNCHPTNLTLEKWEADVFLCHFSLKGKVPEADECNLRAVELINIYNNGLVYMCYLVAASGFPIFIETLMQCNGKEWHFDGRAFYNLYCFIARGGRNVITPDSPNPIYGNRVDQFLNRLALPSIPNLDEPPIMYNPANSVQWLDRDFSVNELELSLRHFQDSGPDIDGNHYESIMGVKGLLGCLERNQWCKQVIGLKELVDQRRSESQSRPLIIIDGRSVCSTMLGNSPALLFNYAETHQSLSALQTLLTSLDVEVVTYFAGSVEDSEYYENRQIERAEKIVAHMSKWHEYETIDEIKVAPLKSYREIARFIFGLYFEVVGSVIECEAEMIHYARDKQCLAIIGNDTDFLIYNTGFYYWPIKNINYAKKTVEMYDMKKFADRHNVNFEHLPIFASFLGNHIMSAEKLAKYFVCKEGIKKKLFKVFSVLTQHRKLSLQQLRQSSYSVKIFNYLFPHAKDKKSLYQEFEKSIAMYVDNVYIDKSEELNEIHKYAKDLVAKNKIQTSFVELLKEKEFFHFSGFQRTREGVNYFLENLVYADLRKRLYYMLFRDESCTIKEYKLKYNMGEEKVQLEVEDTKPLKFDLAVNMDLLDLWKNEEENIEELKWELLINSVSVDEGIDIKKIRLLEPKYYYPVLILHYLLNHPTMKVLEKWEADVFLCHFSLKGKVPEADECNLRAVELINIYNSGLIYMCYLLAASGFPISIETLMQCNGKEWHFDGKAFHNLYCFIARGNRDIITDDLSTEPRQMLGLI